MSCLFDSLGAFFRLNGNDIRQIICDYLEKNNPILEDISTKTILDMEDSEYIAKMRDPRCWGGGNEIRAACNIWSVKIVVYLDTEYSKKIEFLPLNEKYNGYIELVWYGNHYEPISRK